MTLSIGSVAPDFTAETTRGPIQVPTGLATLGDPFSHPKAFTPVCTTELGYMAGLEVGSPRATPRSSASASMRSRT